MIGLYNCDREGCTKPATFVRRDGKYWCLEHGPAIYTSAFSATAAETTKQELQSFRKHLQDVLVQHHVTQHLLIGPVRCACSRWSTSMRGYANHVADMLEQRWLDDWRLTEAQEGPR